MSKNLTVAQKLGLNIHTAVLVLLTAIPCLVSHAQDESVLLANARLIIGDGTVIENGAILIRGGMIEAVVAAGEPQPASDTVIDASGKTILPGLIDGHSHIGYEGYRTWGASNYTRENVIEHLQRYAYYGFSAVLSAGSDPHELAGDIQATQQQRLSSAAADELEARLLFAAGMGPPNQGPNDDFLRHVLNYQQDNNATILTGLTTANRIPGQLDEIQNKGIKYLKVWVDDRGGSQIKLKPPLINVLGAEAKARDMLLLVHQQGASDMRALLRAGVSGYLHGRLGPNLDARLAQQLAANDTFLVPNLGLGLLRRENVANDRFLSETLKPITLNRMQRQFATRNQRASDNTAELRRLQLSMRRLLDNNVDIVLGTDSGAVRDHFFGYTGHRELEIFVSLGMSNMQAIMSATSVAADRLGLAELGSLHIGKKADLLVLDENPLEDIRNTRRIAGVYIDGRRVNRRAMRQRWSEPLPQ